MSYMGMGDLQRRKYTALCHRQKTFASLRLNSYNAFSPYLCTQEENAVTSTRNTTAEEIPLPYSLWNTSQINFLAKTVILLANSDHNRVCLTLLKVG